MKKRMFWTSIALMTVLALVAGCTSPPDVDVSGQPTAASEQPPVASEQPTSVPEQPTVTPEQPTAVPEPPALAGKLIVFHAGSLTVPMDALAEAFRAHHHDVTFETEASGSNAAARKISELEREADLMMSADYTVIDKLLIPDFADWNVQFARNTMVIAYTDESLYADEISADNWYEIFTREGVVYGHSDPDADPCGYRTLLVWQLAEKHYDVPGLYGTLEEHCPPENVRPKSVELIALLESGDMDYAWEYRSVAVQHGLKFVELPDEINLSMVEHTDFYSQATVEVAGKEPGTVMTMVGKPIVYGVTIPKNAPSLDLALEFVKFLLGPEGQAIMEAQGQPPIVPPVAGDVSSMPAELQGMVEAAPTTPPLAADAALRVTGAVENELALSRADLEAMGAEELTVEHPKKGEQTYEGVRLSKVLEAASPTGTALTFTADDGYTVDLPLADAQACADCLVAFDGDSLRMAMPGMEGSFWVKGMVAIEVK
ncbi:MAG: tungstate ABC transporter substrate-binding protein WtpA [Chloroflexota bacterium]|nr:tungstate ABC transporter substrate-binding protein WtpA [Chloroflexota bacterium]